MVIHLNDKCDGHYVKYIQFIELTEHMQIAEEINLRWYLIMMFKVVDYSSERRTREINPFKMHLSRHRGPFEVVVRIHHARLRPEGSSLLQHSSDQGRIIPSHYNELNQAKPTL